MVGDDYESDNTRDGGGTSSTLRPSWSMGRTGQRLVVGSEKGITHDVLKESLAKFTGMLYWCMCDETGSEGTYHTHVYFVLRTPTVHTVVENRFPNIHRENVKGTSQQNRDYVLKASFGTAWGYLLFRDSTFYNSTEAGKG